MWFTEPNEISKVLLETPLEPETDEVIEQATRADLHTNSNQNLQEMLRNMPIVSIGQPETWPLDEVYPRKKMPPSLLAKLTKADFYLVRLACSFRPVHREHRILWARFLVMLQPDAQGQTPLATDLYPLEVSQEIKRQLTVSLNPALKFHEVEVSTGELAFGLEYRELQPRISASGVGQSDPSWDYSEVKGITLQGSKGMYLLVKVPKGMRAGHARLDLVADVAMRDLRLPVVVRRNQPQSATLLTVKLWE